MPNRSIQLQEVSLLDDSAVLLRRGDVVRVKNIQDIFSTLDESGALDGLPFMPEMAAFCGQTLVVARRAEKTCVDGHSEAFREFRNNDVVLLEDVRCTGAYHDNCQRGCMHFWKEAWLDKTNDDTDFNFSTNEVLDSDLLLQLPVKNEAGIYQCQSANLERATVKLPRVKRLAKILREVRVGNHSFFKAVGMLLQVLKWKVRGLVLGKFPSGSLKKTPSESLNLQPGDWVVVKPYREILSTLDKEGKNRGMRFDLDQRMFCEKKYRVKSRLDKMIREDSGKMLKPQNTVILEGVYCQCIFATGGCPRMEAFYWREIWLERVYTGSAN